MIVKEIIGERIDMIFGALATAATKPFTGSAIGISGMILMWIQIIGPIVGFLTILLGFVCGIYALVWNIKRCREQDREILEHQQQMIESQKKILEHFCKIADVCPNRKS